MYIFDSLCRGSYTHNIHTKRSPKHRYFKKPPVTYEQEVLFEHEHSCSESSDCSTLVLQVTTLCATCYANSRNTCFEYRIIKSNVQIQPK